jgi:hypothetical protein
LSGGLNPHEVGGYFGGNRKVWLKWHIAGDL